MLLKTLFRYRLHQYCYRNRLRRQRRNRSNTDEENDVNHLLYNTSYGLHNNLNDENDRFEQRRMHIRERIIVEVCNVYSIMNSYP